MKSSSTRIPCPSTKDPRISIKQKSSSHSSRQCASSMSKSTRTRIPVLEQGIMKTRPKTAIQRDSGASRSSSPDDATYAASSPTLINMVELSDTGLGKESESISCSLDSAIFMESASCTSDRKTSRCHVKPTKLEAPNTTRSRLAKKKNPVLDADKITAHLQACREKNNASIQLFFYKQASDSVVMQMKREKLTKNTYMDILNNLKTINRELQQSHDNLEKNIETLQYNQYLIQEKTNSLSNNSNIRFLLGEHQAITT